MLRERKNSPCCEATRADLVAALVLITAAEGPAPQGNDQSFLSRQSRAMEPRPLLEQRLGKLLTKFEKTKQTVWICVITRIPIMLLLLLLSRFSRVRLYATP